METHFEGVVPTEVVQHDGTATSIDLHFHVSSTHHRVTRVEDSPLDELLSDRSFDGVSTTSGHPLGVSGLNKPVLHIRLTNERDLYFLYTLDVDDRTYRIIRQRNQLRVDFSTFHRNLTALIERVLSESSSSGSVLVSDPSSSSSPSASSSSSLPLPLPLSSSSDRLRSTFRCQLLLGQHQGGSAFDDLASPPGGTGGLGVGSDSQLHSGSGSGAGSASGQLSFIEMTPFRQTNLLQLSLSRGSDSEIKSYLSSELQMYKHKSIEYSARLRSLQSQFAESSNRFEGEIERLRNEMRSISEVRERDVTDVRERLLDEISKIKQDHEGVLRQKEVEKKESLADLREQHRAAVLKLESVGADNVLLTDLKAKLTSQNHVLQSQLDALKGRQSEDLGELERARNRLHVLELASVDSDKLCKANSVQIAALQQQVRDKEEQIESLNKLVETLRSQSGQNDEAASVYKKQSARLQRKVELCTGEIQKGNRAITAFRRKCSRYRKRMGELDRLLGETDRLVKEREQDVQKMKLEADSFKQQLKHRENEIQIKDRQLEEVNLGRDKLMRDLSTQKEMVDHLSTQLNDLQSSPVLSSGLSALGRTGAMSRNRQTFFDQAAFSRRYGTGTTGDLRTSPSRMATTTNSGLGGFRYSASMGRSGIGSSLLPDPLTAAAAAGSGSRVAPDGAEADIVATEGVEERGDSDSFLGGQGQVRPREPPLGGGERERPVILKSGKRQFN